MMSTPMSAIFFFKQHDADITAVTIGLPHDTIHIAIQK